MIQPANRPKAGRCENFIPFVSFLMTMAVLSPVMGETVFEETFDTLDGWEPWTFDSIPSHSTYEVVGDEDGQQRVLLMKSDNALDLDQKDTVAPAVSRRG